ncbi:MAG: MT-A70 family methyltransferase [Rhodospirillaceae bacterium]
MSPWPFGDLKPLHYGVLLIDPPWRQAMRTPNGYAKSPEAHYACMSLAEIAALPVDQLAAPDCFIVLWSLWNLVAPGDATGVLRAWRFVPKSGGAWFKKTSGGKDAFGTGYGFRGSCEPFLTGAIGSPIGSFADPKIRSRSERNGLFADVEEGGLVDVRLDHSRKPESMAAALERMFPDVPKAELFARRRRAGWDVWGDQVDLFEAAS